MFQDNKTYFEKSLSLNYQATEKEFNAAVQKAYDLLSQYLNPAQGTQSALDLGCGPGAFSKALSRLGYTVTGVDYSDTFISIASKNLSGLSVDLRMMDIRNIGRFPAETFDIINCTGDTLLYLSSEQDIKNLLEHCHRVGKYHGKLLFEFRTFDSIPAPENRTIIKDYGDHRKTLILEYDEDFVYTTDINIDCTTNTETKSTSRKLRLSDERFLSMLSACGFQLLAHAHTNGRTTGTAEKR